MIVKDAFSRTYVYAHFVGSECIYVGVGSLSRAFCNRRNPLWRERTEGESVDVVVMGEFLNRADALKMEMNLISTLLPHCNVYGNSNHKITRPTFRKPVRHIPTGVVYDKLTDAARATRVGVTTIRKLADGEIEPIARFNFEWADLPSG